LAEVRIVTGKTHQIRAHSAAHGFPLAGDVKYGGHRRILPHSVSDFFLHARKIEFETDQAVFPRQITAPLPESFKETIENLFGWTSPGFSDSGLSRNVRC
jgi:23S rRNA pseudouridine955/2504/2580 synthase